MNEPKPIVAPEYVEPERVTEIRARIAMGDLTIEDGKYLLHQLGNSGTSLSLLRYLIVLAQEQTAQSGAKTERFEGKLKELIKQWKDRADLLATPDDHHAEGMAGAYYVCIDELTKEFEL